MIKTIVLGLILGLTLGVALATELFARIGIHPQTLSLVVAGLFIAMLLVHRGIAVIGAVLVLTISVLQPAQLLVEHGFDKDVLMVALLLVVVYPVIHKVMQS